MGERKGENNSTGEGGKGLGPDVAVMGVSWKKEPFFLFNIPCLAWQLLPTLYELCLTGVTLTPGKEGTPAKSEL